MITPSLERKLLLIEDSIKTASEVLLSAGEVDRVRVNNCLNRAMVDLNELWAEIDRAL